MWTDLAVAAQEHKLLGARTARFRAHTP
jgi:hypothetical protein